MSIGALQITYSRSFPIFSLNCWSPGFSYKNNYRGDLQLREDWYSARGSRLPYSFSPLPLTAGFFYIIVQQLTYGAVIKNEGKDDRNNLWTASASTGQNFLFINFCYVLPVDEAVWR